MIVCIPKEGFYKLEKDYTICFNNEYKNRKLVQIFLKLKNLKGWNFTDIPKHYLKVNNNNEECCELTFPAGLIVKFTNKQQQAKYIVYKKYNKDINFNSCGIINNSLNGAEIERVSNP